MKYLYYPVHLENNTILLKKIIINNYDQELLSNGDILLTAKISNKNQYKEEMIDYKEEMIDYKKELFDNNNCIKKIKNDLVSSMDGSLQSWYEYNTALKYFEQIKNNINNNMLHTNISEEIKKEVNKEIFETDLYELYETIITAKNKNEKLAKEQFLICNKKYDNNEYTNNASWYDYLHNIVSGEDERIFFEEINKLDKNVVNAFKKSVFY